MRKKIVLFAAAALALASCTSDLSNRGNDPTKLSNTIGFQVGTENVTRATPLHTSGHYNFGVFAYKSTDKVNNIMADYLVGYKNAQGYSEAGTTVGDAAGQVDGLSLWMYEGMGHAEYNGTYAGETVNPNTQYASNVANQYLRYWDNAADYTCFYAYAPYVNGGASGSVITYVDGQKVGNSNDTYVMTIPNGTIKHGYDKADEFEFMYAWTKVEKANYGHDVALNFNRLNAKVNIKFWEDIPGYNVRIIDLKEGTYPGVYATPAINDGNSNHYGYKVGKIYTENGAKIQFAPIAGTAPTMKQFVGSTTGAPLNFVAPAAAHIGESRLEATPSTTTYFAIPKGDGANVLANDAIEMGAGSTVDGDLAQTGLTFHVSYELISTTGEVITVKDATVFVPTTYTNWVANTHYTYIFKITKGSNGSTEANPTIDPTDPEVPTTQSLYPIVFDNCTVEDWATSETEYNITDGTNLAYHDVQLSQYSVESGASANITVTVTDNDSYIGHAINYANVVVTGPDATVNTWYTGSGTTPGVITVPATATSGVYTVTYTCPATPAQQAGHVATWSEKFVVSHAYQVKTNLTEVGTKGAAATKLAIQTKMDGNAFADATTATGLSIEYPLNKVDDKVTVAVEGGKAYVVVANNAEVGKYKLVYTVKVEGVDVKVAEATFDVVDYNLTLDHAVVYNKVGGNTVVANSLAAVDANVTKEYTVTTASGISISGNTVTVDNNTAEGDYTVTLTVNKGTVSEVVYTKSFNVQNQYSVTLSKNTLQRDLGRGNDAAQGSDAITITTLKNGVASNGETAKLKIKLGATDVTSNFTIDCVQAGSPAADTNTYTLKVNKEAAVNEVYTVEYTGQTGKVATVNFTVQK